MTRQSSCFPADRCAGPARYLIINMGINLLSFLAVGIPEILLYTLVQPTQRGFFCNDETLDNPFYPTSTVPNWLLITGSIGLPLLVIFLVELLASRSGVHRSRRSPNAFRIQRLIVYYLFGFMITVLLTDVIKFSVGRLRPHFFDRCQVERSSLDCGTSQAPNYVEYRGCGNDTSPSEWEKKNVRLSFPSGHSSLSAYAATFTVMYLQAATSVPEVKRFLSTELLILPSLQVVFISLALLTGISRVTDYMHHPTDVLAGFFLGVLVQVLYGMFTVRMFDRRFSVVSDQGSSEEALADVMEGAVANQDALGTHQDFRARHGLENGAMEHSADDLPNKM